MFEIDSTKEEAKHKHALSHYLEKIHNATGYQNKDVAEKLGLDKSYYSKVRSQQIAPITNSIITLKRFASLNNMNILDFVAKMEGIDAEIKENDWLGVLQQVMIGVGPILRRVLIHERLKLFLSKDKDNEWVEDLMKCFLLTSLLVDMVKYPKWLDLCVETILQIHQNIGIEKSNDIKNLIARIKIKSKS